MTALRLHPHRRPCSGSAGIQRPRAGSRPLRAIAAVALGLWCCLGSPAVSRAALPTADLADLSIEQLVNLEITSVGKKEMPLFQSPAAVSVVTNEDVRRLGIDTLPDALRLVPGMNVSRVNAHSWAVSARGFNLQYANKLLVLVDGRSVYTPSFGGVFWDAQDVVLEDLDRIEVIRGPGATLWGANAVNGVINITTKSARETQGTLVSTSYGTQNEPSILLRQGAQLGADTFVRGYIKYVSHPDYVLPGGDAAGDPWRSVRAGFRADSEPNGTDLATLQGDIYEGREREALDHPLLEAPFLERSVAESTFRGANLVARWTRTFSRESQLSLQAYYDHLGNRDETRDTTDVQLEHRFAPARAHDLVWGANYRWSTDELPAQPGVQFTPASRDLSLVTMFVQDEIAVVPDRWALTLGAKLEHNDLTGFEFQPNVRVRWTPGAHSTAWASAAHAVSTPSRIFRDGRLDIFANQPPASPPLLGAYVGNPDVQSERLNAYELGYRVDAARDLSLDLAAFYNRYDGVINPVPGTPVLEFSPVPHLLLPLVAENSIHGETHGAELSVQWQPVSAWRLAGSYTFLKMDLRSAGSVPRSGPGWQASVRSYLDLPGGLELNGALARTAHFESPNELGEMIPVPAYTRLDLGLVWKFRHGSELGVWGENLLDPRHFEGASQRTSLLIEVPRTFSARATFRF